MFLINFFHMGAILCFFPAIFMSSTHTDKNKPLFSLNKKTFPIGYFSRSRSNKTSSNCLSHDNPAHGCPSKFGLRSTTRSSMFAQDFGHLCRGRRIHTSGHSDLGTSSNLGASSNFTRVWADTAESDCHSDQYDKPTSFVS